MLISAAFDPAFNQLGFVSPQMIRLVILVLVFVIPIVLARFGLLMPRHLRLRSKGLELLLQGKPAEAEQCYRAALDLSSAVGQADRVRLLVCLCDALFDQGRYEEAKQYLDAAFQIGDPSGSGQGSMCDLLLAMKKDPERAIQMADEALQLICNSSHSQAFGTGWDIAKGNLYEAKSWARKTQALVLLDRQAEARNAIERALRILESSKEIVAQSMPESSVVGSLILGGRLRRMKELTISATHWQVGLALMALHDKSKAIEQFQVVRSTDRRGKYRILAQKKLRDLGYAIP